MIAVVGIARRRVARLKSEINHELNCNASLMRATQAFPFSNRPQSMENKMIIRYIDAFAGAGKTYALLKHVAERVNEGSSFIFCQPTTDLIAETIALLRVLYPEVIAVSINHLSTPPDESVVGRITKYLKNANPEPHVLFVTWNSFERLNFIADKRRWDVVIDEIPSVHRYFRLDVPETHGLLTEHLENIELHDSSYSAIFARKRNKVSQIATNKGGDEALMVYRNLAYHICSRRWGVYINNRQYEHLISGKSKNRTLHAYAMLRANIFDGFNSVLVAGACFKESFFYRWLSRSVKFAEAKELYGTLKYERHPNGELLTIFYGLDGSFSKRRRDKPGYWNGITQFVINEFGDCVTLRSTNERADVSMFEGLETFIRLPHSPHGLNKYMDIDNVAFLSAFNLYPDHNNFLREILGMTKGEVDNAMHRQIAYQEILRSSLRDPENKNPKKVFVPDHDTAAWLQSQFDGSTIQKVDLGIEAAPSKRGRPRKYEDNKSRQAAYDQRQREQKAKSKSIVTEPDMQGNIESASYENSYKTLIGNNVRNQNFIASVYVTFDQQNPEMVITESIDEFEDTLRQASLQETESKEDNILFCPALFEEGKRSEAAIIRANGIVLDFDGGDIDPITLSQIFPHLRMTTYATYSATRSDFRYRAYIPTSQCMTADTYKAIATHIRTILIENGFTEEKRKVGSDRKAHGLDRSKLSAASLFYFPCVPADPEAAFFRVFKDGDRKPLNVTAWLEKAAVPDHVLESISSEIILPSTMNPHLVEKAIERYRLATAMPGNGNHASFVLMLSLGYAGCSEMEARSIARQEFMASSNWKERINEIDHRVTELKMRGFFMN